MEHMPRNVRWKPYRSVFRWFYGGIRTQGQIIKTVRKPRVSYILYTAYRFRGYINISSLIGDNVDNKVGTLDPGPVADGIQHNLRPLLRNKYRLHDTHHGHVEESLGSDWDTWGRELGGMIKYFGMIDQPKTEDKISCHSLQYNTTR